MLNLLAADELQVLLDLDLCDERKSLVYFYFKAGKATYRQNPKVFTHAEKIQ